jgi:hypothetical protein
MAVATVMLADSGLAVVKKAFRKNTFKTVIMRLVCRRLYGCGLAVVKKAFRQKYFQDGHYEAGLLEVVWLWPL